MSHEPACELLPQKVQLGDAAAAAAAELQPLLVAELQLVAEQRLAEQRLVEQRLVEQRLVEQLVEQRPVEQRPVEQRLVEQRPVEQRRLVELLGRLPVAVELQLAGRAVQRQQRAGPGKHAELAQQKVEPGKQADLAAAAAAAGGLPQLLPQQRRAGLAGTGYDYVESANEVQGRP